MRNQLLVVIGAAVVATSIVAMLAIPFFGDSGFRVGGS